MTIAELANTVAQCFPRPIEVRIAKTPDSSRPPERYVPLTKRVWEELGLHQIIDLKEGIRRTLYNLGLRINESYCFEYCDKKISPS